MAQKRIAEVTAPGGDSVKFRAMRGHEAIGQLFHYEVDLLSEKDDLKVTDLLGQSITVHLETHEKGTRHFNGIVASCTRVGADGKRGHYRATLRPWLWMLTHSADCRIFQHQTVPDIIQQVFRDHGFSDFEVALSGAEFRSWDYLVQYRETAFNFVSRLMELEGIYYFFKHEDGKHTLVLDNASRETISKYDTVPYFPRQPDEIRERDHIDDLQVSAHVRAGKHVTDDYDFARPKANLEVNSTAPEAKATFDFYDYPGGYVETKDGDGYIRSRMESQESQFETLYGAGNARGLTAGFAFTLDKFPRKDLNKNYLITSVSHAITVETFESGRKGSEKDSYRCEFTAVDSKAKYRLERTTPKPRISGAQTAVVVGKSGEDIWTDEYGRLKLQFHWDRQGKSDESSSCWVRVAQPWAGSGFGGLFTPRLGQEVIVEFLEGDPDRPLVVGSVYNADNRPAWDMPKSALHSGVRTRSSKGGNAETFNEIRLQDEKGEELFFVQAERDHETIVKNDQRHAVGHDRERTVDNNETISVGQNRSKKIGKNESITVGEDHAENIGKKASLVVGETRMVKIGKDQNVSIGGDRSQSIAGKDVVNIGKELMVTAAKQITLQAGETTLTLRASGEILLNGTVINLKGKGSITMRSGGPIALKGSPVSQN